MSLHRAKLRAAEVLCRSRFNSSAEMSFHENFASLVYIDGIVSTKLSWLGIFVWCLISIMFKYILKVSKFDIEPFAVKFNVVIYLHNI